MTIDVVLPTSFTPEHAAALGQYLRDETSLNRSRWALIWDATDMLRQASVISQGRTQTFADIYDDLVDRAYADAYIEALHRFEDIAQQAEQARAATARRIIADLRESGYYVPGQPETQLLLVFCLYWWQAFAKGYAFEIEILRDLAASGVPYQAHDLRDRQARLAAFDLVVMGFRGDIKTSTYFFAVARGRSLPHDFYLTRLWNRRARRWQRVALLKPDFWAALDGETRPSPLDRVLDVLPEVAQIKVDTQNLIVVDYQRWKEMVKERLEREQT